MSLKIIITLISFSVFLQNTHTSAYNANCLFETWLDAQETLNFLYKTGVLTKPTEESPSQRAESHRRRSENNERRNLEEKKQFILHHLKPFLRKKYPSIDKPSLLKMSQIVITVCAPLTANISVIFDSINIIFPQPEYPVILTEGDFIMVRLRNEITKNKQK